MTSKLLKLSMTLRAAGIVGLAVKPSSWQASLTIVAVGMAVLVVSLFTSKSK